jgi:alkylation response protein AidB-like acyl-CoA dehydrogenase
MAALRPAGVDRPAARPPEGGADGNLIKPVLLTSSPGQLALWLPAVESMARAAGNVPALLDLARKNGSTWPRPGEGHTAILWELLATVSAADVAAGRVLEPHLDALAILSQAGHPAVADGGAWGVFAAEGPGLRLEARADGDAFRLDGAKPWCSLAGVLDQAVITAHTDDGGRAAFAVDLRHHGVTAEEPAWIARGLREIPSGTVHFSQVPATPVGGAGWYLSRPGFAWGGMGVAACWLGGAIGVARDFRQGLQAARDAGKEPDQVALANLGEVDRTVTACLHSLARAADRIDQNTPSDGDPSPWSEAQRLRGTVAAAVERVLQLVGSARGPAPLAFDEPYAKRMADLALYVRQHHGQRDDAQLGALALKGDSQW